MIADVVTTALDLSVSLSPGVVGWNDETTAVPELYAKVVNKSGAESTVTVTVTYIPIEN